MTSAYVHTAFAILAGVSAACVTSYALAADASHCSDDEHAKVQLLAGSRSSSVMMGGINIQLKDGWKTYWRYPGDSGIAPEIDFSESENVENVSILWPSPKAFDDGAGGQSLGYEKQVIVPLRVTAKQNDKPLVLRAKLRYAVCKDLCVPLEATCEHSFASVASTHDGQLRSAMDSVPKPASLGDSHDLSIRNVEREGNTILVDVTAPASENPQLFVEGPSRDWALPVPKRVDSSASGIVRFAFNLEGVPSDAKLDETLLRYTLTAGNQSYEINISIPNPRG